jgi:quercetin dioxygenase-like cupin family protein
MLIAATVFMLGGCAAQEPQAVQSTVLLKTNSSWDGTPYTAYPAGQPELTVLNIKIPANTALKWHQHPMPNAAYVVSGNLTVQARESGQSITLAPGDVLPEIVDKVHRGVTGDSAVELVVFYAGTPEMPLSQ